MTCSGNGVCMDAVAAHTCDCFAGFTGDSCETSKFDHGIDEWES